MGLKVVTVTQHVKRDNSLRYLLPTAAKSVSRTAAGRLPNRPEGRRASATTGLRTLWMGDAGLGDARFRPSGSGAVIVDPHSWRATSQQIFC
jgi:hypothetical protein